MPKSRRAKIVPLTRVKPKGREHKGELMEKMREHIDNYTDVYTFSISNMRTSVMQQIREERREDTKIFMGNNKVMMLALGKDEQTSLKPNLYKLSKFLTGLCGVMYTNLPKKAVKEYFAKQNAEVFARAGQEASQELTVPAGPLPMFPHSMHQHLLKLGLPVKLDKGVIVLLNDTTVCEKGDVLSAEAAQLLKLFGMQTAQFKVDLTAHWANGVAKQIAAAK